MTGVAIEPWTVRGAVGAVALHRAQPQPLRPPLRAHLRGRHERRLAARWQTSPAKQTTGVQARPMASSGDLATPGTPVKLPRPGTALCERREPKRGTDPAPVFAEI